MDDIENNQIKILENEIIKINEKLELDINELKRNNLKKEIILEELLKISNNETDDNFDDEI